MNCGRDNSSKNSVSVYELAENSKKYTLIYELWQTQQQPEMNISSWTVAETTAARNARQFMNCGRDNSSQNCMSVYELWQRQQLLELRVSLWTVAETTALRTACQFMYCGREQQ